MARKFRHIWLIPFLFLLNGCEDGPFFNPFERNYTIGTLWAPNDFNWSLTNTVDLMVDLQPAGEELEPVDGQLVWLLDTLQQVLTRGVVNQGQARLYQRIPSSIGKMIVWFPLTGNYEYIYPWACLGTLAFEYAWADPDEDHGLQYLEWIQGEPPEGLPFKGGFMKASVFGNSDFGVNSLTETGGYWDNYNNDQQWYVTTRNKGPASIEAYLGNPALKLGQSKNQKVEVFQTAAWSETGDFEIRMEALSPEADRIKVKLYLYFLREDGNKISQRVSNYNIKDPEGWQILSVNGEVPSQTAFVKLVIQDQGTDSPWYLDNITSTIQEDPDGDKDGIPDREDDYPNDPERAFNDWYPAEDTYSTLAFEDLWPSVGDYDFNDLVVDYLFNQIRNADNQIVELEVSLKLRAIGGSFHNGFGFELPVEQELVRQVSGQSLVEGLVEIRNNGTEQGSDKAIIMVFEDAWNYLRVQGVSFVNTRSEEEQAEPYVFDIKVSFTRGLDDEELGVPPYNPFIFVNGDRGREIHLHGFEPTEKMNTEWLGTGDDFSNPLRGQYFRTAANLPWALDIPSSFDYPEEKNPVDEAYLNFIRWAETSGSQNNDWYQDRAGYRNPEKIFRKN